jgi:hypothetical protein
MHGKVNMHARRTVLGLGTEKVTARLGYYRLSNALLVFRLAAIEHKSFFRREEERGQHGSS